VNWQAKVGFNAIFNNLGHGIPLSIAAGIADFEDLTLQPKTESLKAFNIALDTLTQAYPHVKGRIMKALAACVRANGVEVLERELVQTIAAILECPTPDLFD